MPPKLQNTKSHPKSSGNNMLLENFGALVFLWQNSTLKSDAERCYYYGARYYDPRISVWLGVDPMAEERSWLSPFNYCQNNPVKITDPDGALDDNYDIYENGDVKVERTNDKTNTYTYHKADGSTEDLGTYPVSQTTDGKDMVNLNDNFSFYQKMLINEKNYLPEDAAAGFLGASFKYYSQTGYATKVNQFMTSNYMHSGKIKTKACMDLQYISTKGTAWSINPRTNQNNVDAKESLNYGLMFLQFGWGDNTKWSMITEAADGKSSLFSNYARVQGHMDHIHFQGFNLKK
jgi:RHS repeat-associated protein